MKNESSFLVKDNQVHVNIPINKSNIDIENRIVSGWATLDNVDQMGDVVTAEASLRAFQEFRGNIREMHDKFKAVGKLVDFTQKEYRDELGEPHTGIWVDVYISKGAEDTWQKVLDGTLSGFSVYGPISSTGISKQYIPEADKTVRFITDYSLLELSLVDSPGNELCNVLEIHKSADQEPRGIVTGVEIENVFWCEADEMAFVSKSETHSCAYCKTSLTSLGWFESIDNSAGEVRKILESSNKISKVIGDNSTEGGQEMPEKEETEATVEETVEATETEEVQPEVEAVEEEAVEVENVEEPSLAGINEALAKIQETLESVSVEKVEREEALSKVREAVEGVEAKVEQKLTDLLNKHEKLATEFTSFKDGLDTVEKRLETIEGATALRKSNDVENEGETLAKGNTGKKNVWSNSFLPSSFDQE